MEISKLRQNLRQEMDSLRRILAPGFEREAIVAGYIYTQKLRCGRPSCHCVKGELHKRMALGVTRFGINAARAIRKKDMEQVLRQVESYRRVRTARMEFRRWFKRTLMLLDKLEEKRRVSLTRYGFNIGSGSDAR